MLTGNFAAPPRGKAPMTDFSDEEQYLAQGRRLHDESVIFLQQQHDAGKGTQEALRYVQDKIDQSLQKAGVKHLFRTRVPTGDGRVLASIVEQLALLLNVNLIDETAMRDRSASMVPTILYATAGLVEIYRSDKPLAKAQMQANVRRYEEVRRAAQGIAGGAEETHAALPTAPPAAPQALSLKHN